MPYYEYVCECGKQKDIATDKFETRKETKERTGGIICECGKQMLRQVPNFRWHVIGWAKGSKVEFSTSTLEESMGSFADNTEI